MGRYSTLREQVGMIYGVRLEEDKTPRYQEMFEGALQSLAH